MEIDARAAGFSEQRLTRINEHLNKNYIDNGRIHGCQVLVARHGYPALFESYGLKDAERGQAMAADTIFRIYSMTKPITSIALMQLYERGLFQLNDPVHRVIPQWRDHRVYLSGEGQSLKTEAVRAPMTFRHVLSHCSGLTYGSSAHPVDQKYQRVGVRRSDGETLDSFVEKLAQVPLRYQPGQQWLYSLATDVCGYLVETLSGLSFDEYLQKYIFGPLGMTDTAFYVAPEKLDRFAANYQRRKDKTLKLIDDPLDSSYQHKPNFFSGGGGLTGTTADYYRFCEMLRGGGQLDGVRVIGSRTLQLMTQNHLKGGRDLTQMAIGNFSETAYEGVGFGLGFAMTLGRVSSGQVASGDYYWGGAASTIFWVDPHEDLVVVFMTQLMPSATFNFRGQLKNIIYGAIED